MTRKPRDPATARVAVISCSLLPDENELWEELLAVSVTCSSLGPGPVPPNRRWSQPSP